ncbi:MAG: diguanylate cyclase, partial [Comamonas sp.]|nr:diguanylate cyclase [Candidatus Comamonas equi]
MRARTKLHRLLQVWWPTATVLAVGSLFSVMALWVMQNTGSLMPWVQDRADWIIAGSTLITTLMLAAIAALFSHQRMRAQLQTQAKHNLLRHRTDRFKALFHQSAVGVVEIELCTGRLVSVNTRFCSMVGYSQQALESMQMDALVHPADKIQLQKLSRQVASGRLPHFTLIHRMLRSDGQEAWVEVWFYPLLSEEGQPIERHIGLIQDVTERHLLQDQLQAREAYSGEMLRFMPVGLVVVGPLGHIEFSNHHFENKTGWHQGELGDESALWRNLCADPQQHATLLQRLNAGRCEVVSSGMNMPAAEYLLRSKSGQPLPMEVSGRFLDGRILLTFVDLSQRKAAEAEIRWLGFYDPVTQLPNRRMLLDRLGDVLTKTQRPGSAKTALLLLDIDNFKSLNETLGHELGDALLRMVATRLANCIASKHTLSRQGGDEFAVVLEDLPAEALEAGRATEQVGRNLLEALRTPFFLNGQDLHVTVSMGAVVVSGQGDTVEELLKRADLALYQAKSAGRDTLQFFDPSMQKAVSARVEMEKDLRLALERHEFDLYFQPQVRHDKVVGAEALLRWDHPVKGFIPPGVFVPAAEESGLILPLGEWVLYAACRQLAQWAKDPELAHLTMAVNVSPRQFYQEGFVQQVQQALQVAGARANCLELELT